MSVNEYASKPRPGKQDSYRYIFSGLQPVKTALLMPSINCHDVQYLLHTGVIATDTHLYVVERDAAAHAKMMMNLNALGFARELKNLTDFPCDLHEVPALPPFDLCFIDLFGSILLKDAQWMVNTLSSSITETTRICFTALETARNDAWLQEVWRVISEHVPGMQQDFSTQHDLNNVRLDKPLLWLKSIFHNFDFHTSKVFQYNDTGSDMFSIFMDDFQRRANPEAFISHKDIEDRMANTADFYNKRYGVTDSDTKRRERRDVQCKEKVIAFMQARGTDIEYVSKDKIMVEAADGNYKKFKTYYEIAAAYDIT